MPILAWLWEKPLAVGETAPDFTLPDADGQPHRLSDLRGKQNVVLVFYPGDDTTVCRKQLCDFRDHWPEAGTQGTTVWGINPQNGRSHRRFSEKFSFRFPLLIDIGQKVAAQYHSSGWIVRRTVYLVGKDGTIRFASRGTPAPAEVLRFAQ